MTDYYGSRSRYVGAAVIGREMQVARATVYSWSKRHNSPIPIYKTDDERLWCYQKDVDAYWARSKEICGANDEYHKAAEMVLAKRRP
jgi:hypothetical protein